MVNWQERRLFSLVSGCATKHIYRPKMSSQYVIDVL